MLVCFFSHLYISYLSANLLHFISMEIIIDRETCCARCHSCIVSTGVCDPLMVLLLFYHLKIFRQCLTWCKLDRPGLHALVDAYQGCFENSATDGKERRYFAGLYLLFRFVYLIFIVLPVACFRLLFDHLCEYYLVNLLSDCV